jgi:hypothetical protein
MSEFNKNEEKILKIADEIAEKDFHNEDIPSALMFMDICAKYDIKCRKGNQLKKILDSAKDVSIENIWKKVYNKSN